VLAAHAKLRAAIISQPAHKDSAPVHEHAHGKTARMSWARLLKRVFDIDIERCECGGRLKIIAAIEEPGVIVRILSHLNLPAGLLSTVAWLLGDAPRAEEAIREGERHVKKLGRHFDKALLHC
jgi:hypothetical protein